MGLDTPWHSGGIEFRTLSSPKALVLPGFPARSEPTDDDRGELGARLTELKRVSAADLRLLRQSEAAMKKLSAPEQDLATASIQQLQKEAEATEEISLPVSPRQ